MDKIFLNKNENRYPHSYKVKNYLRNISEAHISYYQASTTPLLQAISELYHIPITQVVLSHGGEALLKEAVGSIIEPQDTVLIPQGGWLYYSEVVEQYQGKTIFFNFIKNTEGYHYDYRELKELIIKNKPKLVILASPNNPTGNLIEKIDLIDILETTKNQNTYIIIDEAYFGFAKASYTWDDIKSYTNILVLRTFSKFFGLAGIRMGFGFITSGWGKLQIVLKRYLGFAPISCDLALIAIKDVEHYKNNIQLIIEEREKQEAFFSSLGITVFKSQANFIFIQLSELYFERAKKYFEPKDIIIKFFDAIKEPWFQNCIRITVGLPLENEKIREFFTCIMKG